jgi:adenine-specific DNA-methyltransferase
MIVRTSSNPGSIVLDCFCGSGSTLVAAQRQGRRWIGIDQSDEAIKATTKKLSHQTGGLFQPTRGYLVYQAVGLD